MRQSTYWSARTWYEGQSDDDSDDEEYEQTPAPQAAPVTSEKSKPWFSFRSSKTPDQINKIIDDATNLIKELKKVRSLAAHNYDKKLHASKETRELRRVSSEAFTSGDTKYLDLLIKDFKTDIETTRKNTIKLRSEYYVMAQDIISDLEKNYSYNAGVKNLSTKLNQKFNLDVQNKSSNEIYGYYERLFWIRYELEFELEHTQCSDRARANIDELRKYLLRAEIKEIENKFAVEQLLVTKSKDKSTYSLNKFAYDLEGKLDKARNESRVTRDHVSILIKVEAMIEELSHFPEYKTQDLTERCTNLFNSPPLNDNDYYYTSRTNQKLHDVVKSNLNLAKAKTILDELIWTGENSPEIEALETQLDSLNIEARDQIHPIYKLTMAGYDSSLLARTVELYNKLELTLKQLNEKAFDQPGGEVLVLHTAVEKSPQKEINLPQHSRSRDTLFQPQIETDEASKSNVLTIKTETGLKARLRGADDTGTELAELKLRK